MYTYPLKFAIGETDFVSAIKVTGPKKQPIMYSRGADDDLPEGVAPYSTVVGPKQPEPVCDAQLEEFGDKPRFVLAAPGGARMGTVVKEAKGWWSVSDAGGEAVAHIRERNSWRMSGWYTTLTSPTDLVNQLLILTFPVRYDVELRGQRVLRLRETDELVADTGYVLKKTGDFTDAEEQLLLASLMVVFWLR